MFLTQKPTYHIGKIHLKQHGVHPYLADTCMLFWGSDTPNDRSHGRGIMPSVELRKGHGRKSFSDCTKGNWVAALGLCARFVHVMDFGGQFSSSSTGAWELPTTWEPARRLCSQHRCVRQAEETDAAVGDFCSLLLRYHGQEFVLLLKGVAEAER